MTYSKLVERNQAGHAYRQAGIAHIALIVVVIVIAIAAVGFFALKGPSGTSPLSSLGGGAPKVTEDFFSYVEDPLVRKHYTAQANVSTYRIREKSNAFETENVIVTESQVTSSGDFNIHKWEEKGGARTKESIQIGETVYYKDESDGVWWMQTLAPEVIEEQSVNYDLDSYDPIEQTELPKVTHKSLGQEACGALTCHKYEESLEDLPEAPRLIWFDTSQFLLRREEVGFGEFRIENEYSYDNINIQAPSPTKPVPEGRDIYDYMVSDEVQDYPVPDFNSEDYGLPQDFIPEDYGLDPSLYSEDY
jgi:hypothetical protein